ncbi:Aquaporin TIP4-4 [Candidatus Protochlamydia amoebophila]|nr:Aquaporin TIP4-4 [Candidatus Protochlamydia amoebophila]
MISQLIRGFMNLAWLLAEFIGTFTLIFIGVGAICLNEMNPGSVGLVGIALAHGLAIAVMVSNVGHISGGKLNPAVSIGVLIGGRSDWKTTVAEIFAQLAGAVFAALCLKIIFPTDITEVTKLGTPVLADGVSMGIGIMAEAILTFLLVFTVYAAAVDPKGAFKSIAGFTIGGVIIFDILAGGGLTGAAMNPARAFGPALVSGEWTDQIVYWIGPILGGLLAGLLYSKLMLKDLTTLSTSSV